MMFTLDHSRYLENLRKRRMDASRYTMWSSTTINYNDKKCKNWHNVCIEMEYCYCSLIKDHEGQHRCVCGHNWD